MLEFSVVLFHSTSHAIRAEKVLKQEGYEIKMIPTPRQLSSDCGMALRLDRRAAGQVATTLDEYNIPTKGIFAV